MKLSMYLYYQLRMASFVLRGPFWATFPHRYGDIAHQR